MNDVELARNYILDRLSDEQRDECERRFLFDPDFETLMLEQERALLDDYVHMRLSGEEAEAVLRRVAQEPGHLYRLRIAEGLKQATERTPPTEERNSLWMSLRRGLFIDSKFAWFGGVAAAAAFVIVAIIAVGFRQHPALKQPDQRLAAAHTPVPSTSSGQDRQQSTPSAPVRPEQPKAAAISMATVVLLADESRGQGDAAAVSIGARVDVLRLQLTTQEGLDAGRYTAILSNAHNVQVFSADHLPTLSEAGRHYVDLRVPVSRLTSGNYSIGLTQESSDAPALSFRFILTTGSAAN
jgi:hypothetical protein